MWRSCCAFRSDLADRCSQSEGLLTQCLVFCRAWSSLRRSLPSQWLARRRCALSRCVLPVPFAECTASSMPMARFHSSAVVVWQMRSRAGPHAAGDRDEQAARAGGGGAVEDDARGRALGAGHCDSRSVHGSCACCWLLALVAWRCMPVSACAHVLVAWIVLTRARPLCCRPRTTACRCPGSPARCRRQRQPQRPVVAAAEAATHRAVRARPAPDRRRTMKARGRLWSASRLRPVCVAAERSGIVPRTAGG